MTGDEWCDSPSWTPESRAEFLKRARRARDRKFHIFTRKSVALMGAGLNKEALELLDEIAAIKPKHHEHAVTHLHRAEALESLGRIEDAVSAFRTSLDLEKSSQAMKCFAPLHFAYFVTTRELSDLYGEAKSHLVREGPLTLPIQVFMFHFSWAVLHHHEGSKEQAAEDAEKALAAAAAKHSGWPRHADYGLVHELDQGLRQRLEKLREMK